MNQPPQWPGQGQQGQPYGQPPQVPQQGGWPPPQGPYGSPPGPPAGHARRSRRRWVRPVLWSTAGLVALIAVAGALGHGSKPQAPVTARATLSSAPPSRPAAAPTQVRKAANKHRAHRDPVAACDYRPPASGDIYVRYLVPGSAATAQELGGQWRWNYTTSSCMNSVQLTIATAPQAAGYCTQVGYVSGNPGYDPNATPARRLRDVTAQSGPAC